MLTGLIKLLGKKLKTKKAKQPSDEYLLWLKIGLLQANRNDSWKLKERR